MMPCKKQYRRSRPIQQFAEELIFGKLRRFCILCRQPNVWRLRLRETVDQSFRETLWDAAVWPPVSLSSTAWSAATRRNSISYRSSRGEAPL
jgi:hypothetical protein